MADKSSIYEQLWRKSVVNGGGLYVGMFATEPSQVFLDTMERVAVEYVQKMVYHIRSKTKASPTAEQMRRVLAATIDWPLETLESEVTQLTTKFPGFYGQLVMSVLSFAEAIFRDKPGSTITVPHINTEKFVHQFYIELSSNGFVHSTEMFLSGTAPIDRKVVIMDCIRKSMITCVIPLIKYTEAKPQPLPAPVQQPQPQSQPQTTAGIAPPVTAAASVAIPAAVTQPQPVTPVQPQVDVTHQLQSLKPIKVEERRPSLDSGSYKGRPKTSSSSSSSSSSRSSYSSSSSSSSASSFPSVSSANSSYDDLRRRNTSSKNRRMESSDQDSEADRRWMYNSHMYRDDPAAAHSVNIQTRESNRQMVPSSEHAVPAQRQMQHLSSFAPPLQPPSNGPTPQLQPEKKGVMLSLPSRGAQQLDRRTRDIQAPAGRQQFSRTRVGSDDDNDNDNDGDDNGDNDSDMSLSIDADDSDEDQRSYHY